jgi:general secretion pathway protein M
MKKILPSFAEKYPQWQAFRNQWAMLPIRQRIAAQWFMAVLALLVLWFLLLAPALSTLRRVRIEEPKIQVRLHRIQQEQQRAITLRKKEILTLADAKKALQQATKNDLGATAQITSIGDDSMIITLVKAEAKNVANWLYDTRVAAHSTPSSMQLTRNNDLVGNPLWSGQVVMMLPSYP